MGLTQIGGSRVGRSYLWSVNWTRPFATLEVAADGLSLRNPTRCYRFERESIRALRLVGPRWVPRGFHGLAIVHVRPEIPPYVVFWSFDRDALVSALQSEGYPVSAAPGA